MSAPTSKNEVTARKLASVISSLWTKIKSTFQTVANLRTQAAGGVRASSSASDNMYPSEKAVRTELDKMAPGAITTDVTIANGDKMIISDASDSSKMKRASAAFDGSTTKKFLNQKGTFTQVLEADLEWGGDFRTSKSPSEAYTRQNLWFKPKSSAVYVEYCTDRTSANPTWLPYGETDTDKLKLFSGAEDTAASFYCGKNTHIQPGYTGSISGTKDLTSEIVPDQGLRITICCRSFASRDADVDSWSYGQIVRVLMNINTNSATGGPRHCVVETMTGANFKADNDTWVNRGDFNISGDSGWNSIPLQVTFGGGWTQTSQVWVVRFTIWAEALAANPASVQTGNLKINTIAALAKITRSSDTMKRFGTPYNITVTGGAVFNDIKFTARKLKTNLGRTADSTFDGSADQTNIPVTGTLPVGNGGTGKASVTSGNYLVGNGSSALTEKTPKDVGSDVLKSLDTDNGDVVDGDYIVTSYHVDASTISSTTFVRRTAEKLWNYIKSKIASVLGLSTTGYTGNAATATALDAGGADRVKLDGIEAGANNYVHPTSAGNKHVPSGGSDGKFLGYGGSSGTAAWVDNPASGKSDDVSFVFTANGADANLNARLLAAVKLSGSTLSSVRLSFVMAVDIGIGSSGVKGGILRADIAVNSDGRFFAKKCWLTAVTGSLSSADFKIAYGSVSGGNMAVGVVHDGTLADGRSLYVRVLDSYVSGGDLVTNAAITAGKTYEAWGHSKDSADDATVVHNTGDESVAGKKTFTDPVVESVSTSGDYGGFFVQRGSTAATRYRASLEVEDSGSRGLFDYGGSSYAGEEKWIIRKKSDNSIDVGEASNRNNVRIGGVTLDFSGTVGNVADTFYIAN